MLAFPDDNSSLSNLRTEEEAARVLNRSLHRVYRRSFLDSAYERG